MVAKNVLIKIIILYLPTHLESFPAAYQLGQEHSAPTSGAG